MIVDAPAKLNLSLRVLAREASGFHQIESLFCALELCDEVQVDRRTTGIDVSVRAHDSTTTNVAKQLDGDPKSNLVYRAATAFFNASRLDGGAQIALTKRIPSGAGLGGGSSDAAATLSALNELYARPLTKYALLQLGAQLGSDVPFFLCGSPVALAFGRGTRLLPLEPLKPKTVVLAIPGEAVSTADAYRDLAATRGDDYAAPAVVHTGHTPHDVTAFTKARTRDAIAEERWTDVAHNAANDFEPTIFARIPELSRIKADLTRHGARFAMMTGTGSVVFGVFDDDDTAGDAARAVETDFRNVRTIITRTAERDVSLYSPPASLT